MLGIDEDRVNVNGGAVALGHPIGASGARILGALVLELRRRGGGYGCAAICSGGGQGDAIIVQRLTERPHILPPPPGGGAIRATDERGAAFFDLDRTLIAGSLGVPVRPRGLQGGAAHRAATSPATRTRTSSSACAARPTRAPTRVRERVVGDARGRAACATCSGSPARRARRRAAAAVPADARDRLRAPGRGPPDLHLHRRRAGDGRADGDRADLRRRRRLGRRGRSTATTPGREGGPFNYREGKAQAIRELAEREGIDLAASYAYSDSESDLPMLRLVGHPVAVNPDKELARVARAEGWEIMRFERLGPRSCASPRRRPLLSGSSAVRKAAVRAHEPARADRRAARDPRPRRAASPTRGSRRTPREWDREHTFPRELFAELGELGLMGVCVPEEHGGAGADFLSYVLVLEELSRADAGVGVTVAVHTSAGTLPILDHGTRGADRRARAARSPRARSSPRSR